MCHNESIAFMIRWFLNRTKAVDHFKVDSAVIAGSGLVQMDTMASRKFRAPHKGQAMHKRGSLVLPLVVHPNLKSEQISCLSFLSAKILS